MDLKQGSTWIYINGTGGRAYFHLFGDGAIGAENDFIDASIESIGNGWYRCYFAGNGTASSYTIWVADGNGQLSATSGSIYIQDAMLNQGLVAYPYRETTAAPVYGGLQADQPRLDYTDATCPSLLLEPSRTNIFNFSEYFSASNNQIYNVSISANASVSPEGVENAYSLISNASVNEHFLGMYWYSAVSGGTETFSVYAKANGYNWLFLRTNTGSWSTAYANFNLATGETGLLGSGFDSSSIVDMGNGWYRCSVTYSNRATSARLQITSRPSEGSSSVFTGDGISGAYIYGAQLEQASYPTSYIPTYGSAESRGADNAVNTNTIDADNDFTLLIESKSISSASSPKFLNGIGYLNVNSSGNLRYRYNSNNYSVAGDYTQTFKWLLRKDSTSMKIYLNGVLRSTITSGIISGSRDINFEGGMTTNFMTFPKALTDTECIALTTI